MFYVYILYSVGFDKYYCGQTNDPEKRLFRHNSGFNASTRPYRPWEQVLVITKEKRSEAVILETKLKNLNKARLRQFIEKYSK